MHIFIRQLLLTLTFNQTIAVPANKTGIYARIAGNILQVWPCPPVSLSNIKFQPVSDSIHCYEHPALNLHYLISNAQAILILKP